MLQVVTCGSVPLESSYQKVNRCIYTSTSLYEYRQFSMKPAAQQHRYRKWSLRHMEVSGCDFQFGMVFSSVLHLFFGAGASPAAVVYFWTCASSWSWGYYLLLLLHADMVTLFLAEICRWLLHLRSPDWSKSTGQSWKWSICDSICGGECDSGCHPQQQGAAFRFHSLVDPAKPFSQWQSYAIERRVRMLNLPGTPHFVRHWLSCCLRSSFLVHLHWGAKVDVYKLFVACNCLAMT